jgi:LacI family transcriptional regulator
MWKPLGYNLLLGGTGGDPDREERFFENLTRRHIDGIIVSLVSDRSHLMRLIDRTDVPVVIVDRPFDRKDLPTVVMDNFRAGQMAGEHLLSLGHEKFACITGDRDIAIVRARLDGFRDALSKSEITLDENAITEGHFQYESGVKGVDTLLDRGVKFTALWAQNDVSAIGALNRLRERGYRVPGDISLMGLDNVDDSWMARPALTTIAQPYKEIAAAAAELLLRLSRKEDIEETRIVLPPSLVVRESTGPVGG